MKTQECPVCGTKNAEFTYVGPLDTLAFIKCATCGRFELQNGFSSIDFGNLCINRLASYLFYHRFLNSSPPEHRYHSVRSEEQCDTYKSNFENGDVRHGHPVHMDNDIINVWYPKSFDERVDYIIKYLGEHIPHIGQAIRFTFEEALSLLFVDRYEKDDGITFASCGKVIERDRANCDDEARYMLESLKVSGLVSYSYLDNPTKDDIYLEIRLTPKGYSKVDEIQKNTINGKQVLVAMKFGDDTLSLRKAIKDGIAEAGYVAVFIDEVQHNNFITPELLKHIRDSKFIVVDLTHKNNGAYFEEGYAMGVGKPVIQLCKCGTELHFDIAQKNTIMWSDENDIPERLSNRIRATIE